ncbi:hypothetical protein D3C81_1872740 [compost metagenome]
MSVNAGYTEIPVDEAIEPEYPRIPQRRTLQRSMGGKITQAEPDKRQEEQGDQEQ